jgi:hypothetical protein
MAQLICRAFWKGPLMRWCSSATRMLWRKHALSEFRPTLSGAVDQLEAWSATYSLRPQPAEKYLPTSRGRRAKTPRFDILSKVSTACAWLQACWQLTHAAVTKKLPKAAQIVTRLHNHQRTDRKAEHEIRRFLLEKSARSAAKRIFGTPHAASSPWTH